MTATSPSRSLVLHHGDRRWNAPTRLRDLFHDSAPDTYQVVSRKPPDALPPTPLALPQIQLGRASVLRELAARKFGPAVAEDLVRLLDRTPDPDRVARATEALLECDAAEDFLARVQEG